VEVDDDDELAFPANSVEHVTLVPQLFLGISVVPTNILGMTRNTAEGAWTIADEFAGCHCGW